MEPLRTIPTPTHPTPGPDNCNEMVEEHVEGYMYIHVYIEKKEKN
jgi:hypothetical protein